MFICKYEQFLQNFIPKSDYQAESSYLLKIYRIPAHQQKKRKSSLKFGSVIEQPAWLNYARA